MVGVTRGSYLTAGCFYRAKRPTRKRKRLSILIWDSFFVDVNTGVLSNLPDGTV